MALVTIKFKPVSPQEGRVTVIVNRTVSKKAVQRNLIRRRIKAILQPIAKKLDKAYVVIAKPGSAKVGFKELKKEIEGFLRQNQKIS